MTTNIATLILDGKLHQAMSLLEKELEENLTPIPQVYFRLAYVYKQLGQDDKYEPLCQYIFNSQLIITQAFYFEYSLYWLAREDYEMAQKVISQGLQDHPEDAEMNYFAAYIWYMSDDFSQQLNYKKAWTYIHDAFRLSPEDEVGASYYFLRAKIAYSLGILRDALYDVLTVKGRFRVKEAYVMKLIGDIYYEMKEYASSKEMYELAIQLGATHCEDDIAKCNRQLL